jgi:hypothetical protein
LLLAMPSAIPASFPRMFTDAAGRQWHAWDVTGICVVVSVFVMTPLALIAWARAGDGFPGTRRAWWAGRPPEHLSVR